MSLAGLGLRAWWVVFVPALVSLAGCDGSADRDGVRADTPSVDRVVVSNPDSASARLPTLVEELRIGSVLGDCDVFGDVISLAVDDVGRIYVADLQANVIRVFSPQGECLSTLGGEGSGPGEFAMLAGIAWSSHSLWAIDALAHRLTVFDSAGAVRSSLSLGPAMGARFPWPIWIDEQERVHRWAVPSAIRQGTRSTASRSPFFVVRHADDRFLAPPDTFRIPRLERPVEEYSRTAENLTELSPVPHSPRMTLTVDGEGDVWLADQSIFDLHRVTYGGDTTKTVRLRRPPEPLDGAERNRLAATTGIPEEMLPDRKLALRSIHAAANGWLWVATDTGALREWEAFDARGYYVGRVAFPVALETRPPPLFGRETIIGVVRDPLDVQYVVRLRINP